MSTSYKSGNTHWTWHVEEFTQRWRRGMGVLLDEVGRAMVEKLRKDLSIFANRPYNHSAPGEKPHAETYRLVNSLFHAVIEIGQLSKLQVGFTAIQGMYMEKGVEGGKTIVPRRGHFLSWLDSSGVLHIARSVTQGKIEKRPFLERTMLESIPAIKLKMKNRGF